MDKSDQARRQPAIISGERVTLVPFEEPYLDLVGAWRSDPEVTRYWISTVAPTEDQMHAWLERNQRRGTLTWLIEAEDGQPIGYTNLFELHPVHRRAEVSLMIGDKSRWGKGYATEALRTLLRHAFTSTDEGGLGLHKVYLEVFAENTPARRAYLRCGFVEEGVRREDMFRDGAWHDHITMSILDREFLEKDG